MIMIMIMIMMMIMIMIMIIIIIIIIIITVFGTHYGLPQCVYRIKIYHDLRLQSNSAYKKKLTSRKQPSILRMLLLSLLKT